MAELKPIPKSAKVPPIDIWIDVRYSPSLSKGIICYIIDGRQPVVKELIFSKEENGCMSMFKLAYMGFELLINSLPKKTHASIYSTNHLVAFKLGQKFRSSPDDKETIDKINNIIKEKDMAIDIFYLNKDKNNAWVHTHDYEIKRRLKRKKTKKSRKIKVKEDKFGWVKEL